MQIGSRKVGVECKPYVIAEIGINHNGSFRTAQSMVFSAYRAGAECVKFQYHIPKEEMTLDAKKTIPGNSKDSIYDIIKRCTLSYKELKSLKDYTESLNMEFLCSPFSKRAVDRLEDMKVKAYKIGSGECNNLPLIEHIASLGKPMIVSTGMNNMDSIRQTVDIIKEYETDYALLHCTSLYPTPYNKVRLNAIKELRKEFKECPIGLSDHSYGNYTSFGAIPLGASIIEKHYTYSKMIKGPDIDISIDEEGLRDLITGCNAIHSALKGKKNILREEYVTINFAYSSVVSTKKIRKGETLSSLNMWVKRPGTGDFLAKHYLKIVGKKAKCDIPANKQIKKEWIE